MASISREPLQTFAPDDESRGRIKHALEHLTVKVQIEVPVLIGREAIRTGKTSEVRSPHAHARLVGAVHEADAALMKKAVDVATEAHASWSQLPFEARAGVLLRAAHLAKDSWRATLQAACMVGLGKTAMEAEKDAAAGFIDGLQVMVEEARRLHAGDSSSEGAASWRSGVGALRGPVLALTSFDSMSRAALTALAPVVMGHAVIWTPARRGTYVSHFIWRVMREAGMPDGVFNLVPGDGAALVAAALESPSLAGVLWDGWPTKRADIAKTLAGARHPLNATLETARASVMVVHPDSDVSTMCSAIVRGAFEFQGQQRNSLKHVYLPRSLHDLFRPTFQRLLREVSTGDVEDFRTFVGGVIDRKAFERCKSVLDEVRRNPEVKVLGGAKHDDSKGYFIEPTAIVTTDQALMTDVDAPGPIVVVHVYDDAQLDSVVTRLRATQVPYAAVSLFARPRDAIAQLTDALLPSTKSVVVQDSPARPAWDDAATVRAMLSRFVDGKSVRETFDPPMHFTMPHMAKP